jgi:hypothetical protein
MGAMNNINNSQFQNMNQCPVKGIIDQFQSSYINSVLQTFSSLNCIINWFQQLKMRNNIPYNENSIIKQLYYLLSYLYSGQNVDSSNVVKIVDYKLKMIYNKSFNGNPYDFFLYFLALLHQEINIRNNPTISEEQLNNQSIENMRKNDYMYYLFSNFFQQNHNSIISNNFFFIFKKEINCPNCPPTYSYSFEYILNFDIDQITNFRNNAFPYRKCQN